MDIKVTSTGKVFYQIDNGIAHLLMEAFPASFERADALPKPPAPAAFEVKWGVGLDNGGYYRVEFSQGARTEYYFGPPSQLIPYYQKKSIVVPDHILKQYTPLWRPREFEHPAVQAAWWAEYSAIHGKEKK